MNRLLTIIAIGLFSISAFAQIPNGGFETWDDINVPSLSNWSSVGNVQQSTDVVNGTYAVKLENKKQTNSFGIVTNADITSGIKGGEPYSEIPLVFRFSCKYDLATGDIGKAYVIMKLKGVPLATVDFTLNGNSGDTFTTYKIPIQWQTSVQPDSVIVLFSTVDPNSPSFNGDGYMIVDNVVFETFGVPDDNIENPSFEDWSGFDIHFPESWYTTDLYINDLIPFPTAFGGAIRETSIVQGGNSALHLLNKKVDNNIIPGIAFTGTSVATIESPGFPVSKRWKRLHGFYRFSPDDNDTAVISVGMFKQGNLIGFKEFKITEATSGNSYTYFYFDIDYSSSAIPDSATIAISCASFDAAHGINTELWVDDLSFTDHTVSTTNLDANLIKIYPNPANSLLIIETENTYDITIVDYIGQTLIKENSTKFDISGLVPGIYYVRCHNGNELIQQIKFIKL